MPRKQKLKRTTPRNPHQGNGVIEMDLIRKIAWKFHAESGMPFEDLVQEAAYAWWAWAEGHAPNYPKYDPCKSAFTSFAYMCVSSHLRTLSSREGKIPPSNDIDNYDLENGDVDTEARIEFLDRLRRGPPEVQFVVKLVLETPTEILSLNTPTDMQRELCKRLEKEFNLTRAEAKIYLAQLRGLLFDEDGCESADAHVSLWTEHCHA